MSVKKKIFCYAFLTFFPFILNSQNKRLDSLIELSKNSKDTLLVSLLNEISWEYKNSNQDSALYYGQKALKEAKILNQDKSISESYNSLGNVYQATSMTDSAIYYHKKSLHLKVKNKDSLGIADTYTNLGIISDERGNYLKALEFYFEALKIYEKKSLNFQQIPAVLVNIGIVYKKQKKYDKVLEYYQKALKIYVENNYQVGVTIITGNIGAVLLKQNKNKESIKYSLQARKFYSDLGYQRYTTYMDVNIAEAEYNLKNYSKSIQLYINSVKSFSNDKNLYELSNAKIGLSKSYISVNKFEQAKKHLSEAFVISKKNKFKEFEVKALKIISEVNFKLKSYKDAYKYEQLYHTKKNSLFEKTKVKDINELLVKYESSEKEKEISLQKEQLLEQELAIKTKSLYALLLGAGFIILGILSIGFYRKNQFKRKQLQKEIDLKDALSTIKTQNRLQEQRLRISRDLHDNIGSQLTFIISSLDNLKYISKDANEKLKDKLSNISSFTGDTIHELRDTIWAMNKTEISVEDLHARILSFIEKAKVATEKTTFKITENIDKNANFSSLVGMNIFRVIQEAINNSIKYANASKIEINLTKKDNNFKAIVKDNGTGFDIKTVDLGNGLSNMEKRMSEINGTVNINSQLEKGTKISISISLKNTPNDV